MRYTILLLSILFMFSACKTKQELVEEKPEPMIDITKKSDDSKIGPPITVDGVAGDRTPTRKRRKKLDPDVVISMLELSEEQEVQFLQIWNDTETKMAEVRKNSSGDRQAMREAMRSLSSERNQALEAVFDAEQMKRFRSMIPKGRKRGNR